MPEPRALPLPRRLCAVPLLLALLCVPLPAAAQGQDDSIFNRFAEGVETPARRQRMLEVPVALRLQTFREVDVERNAGLGYVWGIRPTDRIYVSYSLSIAQQRWSPKEGDIDRAESTQLEAVQHLNFWMGRAAVFSFGLGLGLMDGLVVFDDNDFITRYEPYIPVQLGLVVPVGDTVVTSLRASVSPFWGRGPVLSHGRLLFGLGYNY